jgi:two-component system response regulator HydG
MPVKPLDLAASEAEYNAIVEALKRTNFNKSKASRLLNIDRKTLYNKLLRYKILKARESASQAS